MLTGTETVEENVEIVQRGGIEIINIAPQLHIQEGIHRAGNQVLRNRVIHFANAVIGDALTNKISKTMVGFHDARQYSRPAGFR